MEPGGSLAHLQQLSTRSCPEPNRRSAHRSILSLGCPRYTNSPHSKPHIHIRSLKNSVQGSCVFLVTITPKLEDRLLPSVLGCLLHSNQWTRHAAVTGTRPDASCLMPMALCTMHVTASHQRLETQCALFMARQIAKDNFNSKSNHFVICQNGWRYGDTLRHSYVQGAELFLS
jgi:hypothetical protein